MSNDDLRLCFVSGDWAYFADADPTEISGDDWNDAPHDCNASEPYHGFARLVKVAYDGDWEVVGSTFGFEKDWQVLSADDINAGKAPWLYTWNFEERRPRATIAAGVTLGGFREAVRVAGGQVYEVPR